MFQVETTLLSFLILCQLCWCQDGDILVNSGERVRLSCIRVSEAACHWLRDGWRLDFRGRYSLGADSCELVIDPVLPLDQGRYQCHTGGRTSEVGSLRVNMAPGRPRIEAGPRLTVDPGEAVELECEAGGGRPAGEIQWWDEDTGSRISGEASSEVRRMGQSFMTTSRLRLRPERAMSVRCSVHSQQFPAKKYSERVKINLIGEPVRVSVSVGDSVRLDCGEDEVTWSINNLELEGEKERTLEVENFVEAYDGAILECRVGGRPVQRFELKKKTSEKTENHSQGKKTKVSNQQNKDLNKMKGNQKPFPEKYTIYSCDGDELVNRKDIPNSVTIDMNDPENNKHQGSDQKGQKYICSKVLRSKKLSHLRKTVKSLSHKMEKLGRKLKNVNVS